MTKKKKAKEKMSSYQQDKRTKLNDTMINSSEIISTL